MGFYSVVFYGTVLYCIVAKIFKFYSQFGTLFSGVAARPDALPTTGVKRINSEHQKGYRARYPWAWRVV